MRTFLLLIAAVGIAAAQPSTRWLGFPEEAYSGLATNRDGTTILFSSALRLRSAPDQAAWEKIFSWTAQDGVRLYEQRTDARLGEFYHLFSPSLSADGRAISFTAQNDCTVGTVCVTSIERWQSTIRFAGGMETKVRGSARLSANGRYALARSSRFFGTDTTPDITWINTTTGESLVTSVSKLRVTGSRPVADDGFTVRWQDQRLELWRPGFNPFQPETTKPLTALRNASGSVLLSSDAKVVVARTQSGLVALAVETGQIESLSASPDVIPLDVSEDGSVILAREGGTYRVYRRNGAGARDLPFTGTVTESLLSGDGKVVVAILNGSRIVRTILETGQSLDVVPATAYGVVSPQDINNASVARGSLLQVAGGPAVSAAFGTEIWPVIASSNESTSIQVPWEAALDASPNFLHVRLQSTEESNPFEPALILPSLIDVKAVSPAWFSNPSSINASGILAAHQDFSSLVTPDAPAKPGEIIHVYGTGFGEVSPKPLTGQPAPVDVLSPLIALPECWLTPFSSEGELRLPVLYAGLAPGLTGVYQLDLQMPGAFSAAEGNLSCQLAGRLTSARISLSRQ